MPSQTQARKVLKNEIVVVVAHAPAVTKHIHSSNTLNRNDEKGKSEIQQINRRELAQQKQGPSS